MEQSKLITLSCVLWQINPFNDVTNETNLPVSVNIIKFDGIHPLIDIKNPRLIPICCTNAKYALLNNFISRYLEITCKCNAFEMTIGSR